MSPEPLRAPAVWLAGSDEPLQVVVKDNSALLMNIALEIANTNALLLSLSASIQPLLNSVRQDENNSWLAVDSVAPVVVKPDEETDWTVVQKEDAVFTVQQSADTRWVVEPGKDAVFDVAQVEDDVFKVKFDEDVGTVRVHVENDVAVRNKDGESLDVKTRDKNHVAIRNGWSDDFLTRDALQIKNDQLEEAPVPLITIGPKLGDGSHDSTVRIANWPGLHHGTDVSTDILPVAVANTVEVTGFPATQTINGTVAIEGTVPVANSDQSPFYVRQPANETWSVHDNDVQDVKVVNDPAVRIEGSQTVHLDGPVAISSSFSKPVWVTYSTLSDVHANLVPTVPFHPRAHNQVIGFSANNIPRIGGGEFPVDVEYCMPDVWWSNQNQQMGLCNYPLNN